MIGGSGAASAGGNPGLADDPVLEFDRRSRAVLAADLVGYTRLMEAAELDTHSARHAWERASSGRPIGVRQPNEPKT